MVGFFRILIAVVFTAHMIVGCCLHHAHADDAKRCPSAAQENTTQSQCPDSHESGADHSQKDSQDCQGSKCSVVSTTSSVGYSIAQHVKVFVTTLLVDGSSLTGSATNQHSFSAGRLLLPVHLHLANQVLLI
jgi:hypothetical protein